MAAKTKVAPDFLYYALMDGTSEVDSVAFAANLSPKMGVGGWRNLLDFLQPNPYEETRLVDGAHIYLPIVKLDKRAKPATDGIAVVCPGGQGGIGQEPDWKNYDPAPREWLRPPAELKTTRTTHGRKTAAEESAAAMEDFILEPAVQVDSVGSASILSARSIKPDATVFRASLLYLSSHGWLGGFMRGEEMPPWPAAEPAEAREKYFPIHSYFLIGRVKSSDRRFSGPQWIVLAQCSTLNSATWAMWAQVMAESHPPVRGILGYEESSPAAGRSVGIANNFFAALRGSKTFLEAWKSANPGQHWAAIVHKDAHQDTLLNFPKTPLSSASMGDYIGYLPSARGGQAIQDPAPPFTVTLFRVKDHGKPDAIPIEIRADTLDQAQAYIDGGAHRDYIVRISAAAPFVRAKIRFVHIRHTYKEQFSHRQLFASATTPTPGAVVELSGARDIGVKLDPAALSAEIVLQAQPRAKLEASGLEAHHSYLWIHAEVTAAGGAEQKHDFMALGLLYA